MKDAHCFRIHTSPVHFSIKESGVQKTCFLKEHQGWSLEVTLKNVFLLIGVMHLYCRELEQF